MILLYQASILWQGGNDCGTSRRYFGIYGAVPKSQMAVEGLSIRKATEDDIPIIEHLAGII